MAAAMEENKIGLLGSDFVGLAKEQLSQAIAEQGNSGLKRRYIDHGHQVRVVFYSPTAQRWSCTTPSDLKSNCWTATK